MGACSVCVVGACSGHYVNSINGKMMGLSTRITLVEHPLFVGLNHSWSLSADVLLPVYGFQRVHCT